MGSPRNQGGGSFHPEAGCGGWVKQGRCQMRLSAKTGTEATCEFVGPQKKNELPDVDETAGVNPCRHKVCNEPRWEKENSKCEKCDCKNSKYICIAGGGQAGNA